jgi:hypothetical protein
MLCGPGAAESRARGRVSLDERLGDPRLNSKAAKKITPPVELPPRVVITVEPGVYLPAKGFGVRIEDEVLITNTGYRPLTDQFPRKLEDAQAWIAKARK